MKSSPLVTKVENFIKENIVPTLMGHGGDVKLRSIEDGIATITLLGSCSNCPLSQITFEEVIREAILKEFPKEIKDVRLYNEVDDDVWNFAKKILRKEEE